MKIVRCAAVMFLAVSGAQAGVVDRPRGDGNAEEQYYLVVADETQLMESTTPDASVVSAAKLGDRLYPFDKPQGDPDGRQWVNVYANTCPENDCRKAYAGWVPRTDVATISELKPITSWRKGQLHAYAGDYGYILYVQSDGTYTKRSGDEAVRGRLFRKNRLVVGIDQGDQLSDLYFIERKSGALCSEFSELGGEERMCDRP